MAPESSDAGVMQDISSTQPDEITAHVCANLRVNVSQFGFIQNLRFFKVDATVLDVKNDQENG